MIKYTEQLKLKVVRHYLQGQEGFTRVSARFKVAAPHIRHWVALYRQHGMNGLRRREVRYDATFKMSVLQYMWDNGLSNRQAAAHFNIRNITSIGQWVQRFQDGGLAALARPRQQASVMKAPSRKPPPKPDDECSRDELVEKLRWLRMENDVLKKLKALAQEQKTVATTKRK